MDTENLPESLDPRAWPDPHAEALLTPSWREIVPDEDRTIYEAAGYGSRQPLGTRPALLIIDITYNFTGSRAAPIEESVAEWRNSCGVGAWRAVAWTAELIAAFRDLDLPVAYSRGRDHAGVEGFGRWATKNRRAAEDLAHGVLGNQIVEELAPQPGDIVVEKSKPSAFFGTDMVARLIDAGVDTIVATGGTTSGCVRATVLDAFSLNFRVAVAEEATFDRGILSHKVNLFDMHQKYANVLPVAELQTYLAGLRG